MNDDLPTILDYATKRDVKGMADTITQIEDLSRITATFVQPRYGSFAITAQVVRASADYRCVAGRQLDSNGTLDSNLRGLVPGRVPLEVQLDSPETARSVNHGDLVAAIFTHHFYGAFQVVGVAVLDAQGSSPRVGEWFILIEGAPSPLLEGIHVLAPYGERSFTGSSRTSGVLA